jgi:hypothetical protein
MRPARHTRVRAARVEASGAAHRAEGADAGLPVVLELP